MMAASAMYPGLPTPPHATSSFPTTLRICRPAGDHSRLWLEEGLRPGTSYGDVRLVGRDGEIHYSSLVLAAVPALAKGLAGIDRWVDIRRLLRPLLMALWRKRSRGNTAVPFLLSLYVPPGAPCASAIKSPSFFSEISGE